MSQPTPRDPAGAALDFLAGGGEMGRCIAAKDWSNTPLGPIESWPQSLRTTVSLCLASNFPISIAWGPQRTQIYNDGYWPICGAKHPHSMGQDFRECWSSAWPAVGEAFESASAGKTAFLVNQRMFLDRNGYLEETFFTFSFSPIRDETGEVAGLFHPVTELTQQSLAERRLKVLRDLADHTTEAKSVAEACELIAQTLREHVLDVPFALLYTLDPEGRRAQLAGSAGLEAGAVGSPAQIDLTAPPERCWPVGPTARAGQPVELEGLEEKYALAACGPYPEVPQAALALPIFVSGLNYPFAVLVAGVSARRRLDEPYRTFYVLLRDAVANALTNAHAYEAERKRAEALAEIDRAKTAFFSNVSHEFRTPLTLMLGPIEEAMGNPVLPAPVREQLDLAHRNSLRLLKLVNSLLDFSRIEAGRVQASYEPSDLAALTRDLASTFRSAIERAGLHFEVDCPDLAEPVYVDREMWEKIVLNLLSNAFKFTLAGSIAVRLRRVDAHAELLVSDTGVGVPAQEMPRLFERFHRVEGTQGRTHEGSGIGLALVQELLKLHGATVEAQSELGRGTTFRILIPFGSAHLPAERIKATRALASTVIGAQAFVQEALRWLPDTLGAREKPAQRDEALISALDRPFLTTFGARIVLADDNGDMRAYVSELLAPFYAVEAVGDGAEALAAARREPPDLILSDVMMPRLDGFGLVNTLRADAALADVPVILLSARAGEEARIEGLDAGADDYLIKPFSARELLARVGAILRSTELHTQNRRQQAFLDRIVQHAPVGIAVLKGPELMFTAANPAFQAMAGEVPLAGRRFAQAFPQAAARGAETGLREVLATGRPWRMREFQTELPGRAGLTWWEGECLALKEEENGGNCLLWLTWEVTEHKLAQVRLREADRRKNEFLSMLAHELRNPLAPIRNASELLARTLEREPRARAATDMVKRQVTHLTRLVDDLLDVSRITQGRIELRREPVTLSAVIAQGVETVEPLLKDKRHKVSIVSSYRPLRVDGDMARLVQCVANILTNAAKYTDPGGEISISSHQEDAEAVISVRDNGVGIPAELLPRVFELFVQGDRTLDRALGGLGIGLSVVKRLVEMHGGTLSAASPGPGQGSTFEMRLPLLEHAEYPTFPAAPARAEPLRILVVDDNADAANSLAMVLDLDGHTAESVHGAHQALERAAAFKPDVVLLDIGLPEMDGYEVARRIRSSRELADIRLIALTGYGQDEDRQRAEAAGFDAHLVKPVEFTALARALARPRGAAGMADSRA